MDSVHRSGAKARLAWLALGLRGTHDQESQEAFLGKHRPTSRRRFEITELSPISCTSEEMLVIFLELKLYGGGSINQFISTSRVIIV